MPKLRALWLDDKIAKYGAFIKALRDKGFVIKTAETPAEAKRLAAENGFDLVLVDLKLETGSGLDFLEWLANADKKKVKSVCVLSSYLYLDEYKNMIADFPMPIYVLEKNFPEPTSPAFETEIVDRLKAMAAKPAKRTVAEFEKSRAKKLNFHKPFEMRYTDYVNLSPTLKQKVEKRARKQAEATFRSAFENGYKWVLILGSPKNIEAKAMHDSEKLSPKELTDLAVDKNRIPFQFAAEEWVEDMCSGPHHLRSYPTVTLAVPNGGGRAKFDSHFDTGSFWSWLSLELWLDLTGDAELGQVVQSDYRDREIDYFEKTLALQLHDQTSSKRRDVQLPIRLVRRWLRSAFVAECPPDCQAKGRTWAGNAYNCNARTGLIGRNLLTCNGITLTINGASLKTSL